MRWVLLFFPCERVSDVARGYGPWDSAERELACRLSDGMGVVWWRCGDGGISVPGSKPSFGIGMGWNGCGNGVKTWLCRYILDMLIHRKPQPYRFLLNISDLHPITTKAMLIGLGVASTNRTDKFWHTGSAEEYSSEEFDGWGVRSYARVWRSYLQAVLNECYFWFRQCGDVIIYVIPHYLYSDIIVVWMWYLTRIWVIWSTMVILHFDSMDFPLWKSGRFSW